MPGLCLIAISQLNQLMTVLYQTNTMVMTISAYKRSVLLPNRLINFL